ncbi:MAG: aliphatic sulfonate ABC transporter substrate-binding protein [Chloroflexi bacterium]|nr:aliphatic sulfonate ABC transporter substrate-binding protein [Chloroflexota bacterium]
MSTTIRPAGRRLTSVAVLAATVAVVAAACSSSGATSAPVTEAPAASASAAAVACTPEAGTFRMGTEPWLGYGPWWVADEKDLFAQNGLDVKVSSFTTDDEINAALVAGQIDGANIATHTAMRLAQAGTPLTIVLVLDQSNTADAALAAAPVASIKDLKGKKVAYEEGTTSDILLRYALSQNGMTIDDIVKVPTSAADAGTAAIAKRVDAAVTYEPYLTAALGQDPAFKLIYTAAEKPGLISDVFVVRNDALGKVPCQIQTLIQTWDDAVAYYNANGDDAKAIISKAVGATPEDLKTAFDGVDIYTVAQAKSLLEGAFPGTMTDIMKIAVAAGIMPAEIDPTTLLNTTFIDKATQ